MGQNVRLTVLAALVAGLAGACDEVPLLAPTNSTIALTSGAKVLPLNGSTMLTAFVTESAGTPVQNGTTVRFTTTLGSVQPAEVQTHNGLAVVTFLAGGSSGVADVHALSGGPVTGGTGGTTTPTPTNVVQITIGTAAVNTVTLRANPSTVSPTGGTVELVAIVVGESGNALPGISVAFNTDQGSLSAQTVVTDGNGEARTQLTTAQKTSATATAGLKTSTAVTVDLRPGPAVTLTCAPSSGTGGCAGIQASATTNTATVVFTVTKAAGSSNLRESSIEFGDGTTQSLGTLGGGALSVAHTYDGPSNSSPRTYTATVRATDVNNEATFVTSSVSVLPRAPFTLDLAVTFDAAVIGVGRTGNFTATLTGAEAQSYAWDFGDGTSATTTSTKTSHVFKTNGQYAATVTVTTTDGRTATARVEFIVAGI